MISISVKAIRVVHKDLPLYMFGMRAGDILNIAYILPKSRDTPDAIERSLDHERVKDISEYIKKVNSYLPGSVIINFDTTKMAFADFSEHGDEAMFKVELPEHKSPEELRSEVMGDMGLEDLTKDDEKQIEVEMEKRRKKIAYVIDGQHRLKGLELAGKADLYLPVIALKDADVSKAAKIFADINGEQRPVPANLILQIRYEIGDLPGLEKETTRIVHELNNRSDSPFYKKVKIYEKDTKTWIEAVSFMNMLFPIVGTGPLQGMNIDEQITHFINFFNALKLQIPGAFDENRKEYILTQPRGISIALGIFERVLRRCQVYEGGNFDVDSVLRQIKRIEAMTWKKSKYGQLKGAGGVTFLVDKLKLLLPERDDREPTNYSEIVEWFKSDQLVF